MSNYALIHLDYLLIPTDKLTAVMDIIKDSLVVRSHWDMDKLEIMENKSFDVRINILPEDLINAAKTRYNVQL